MARKSESRQFYLFEALGKNSLLLDAGVDIIKVKDLLGHRHVTTTQIYDKRRRSMSESASHDLVI